ncbi:MAG: signal recognition particle-docking protein FtsY [Phycisphaerales bacterium]|nr:signal recognition particle-docking protein FtsY [Phycisphaerales bacterium]
MGLIGGALAKLRGGLARTREAFVGGLRSMLAGRAVDEALIRELEAKLIGGDVGVKTTARLIERVREGHKDGSLKRGEDVLEVLRRELKALWPEADRSLHFAPSGPTVILVTGVNGAGKTTSIAKLCNMLHKDGKTVLVGACDTFRAGAVRQLEIWAQRLGVEIVRGQEGGDPAAVAFDACAAAKARGVDVVILDTAGRLHTQDPLMRQLEKLHKVVGKQIEGGPHEVLLVLDATAGQNALRQAEEFSRAAKVTGILLAKLDGTARGGIVVAIREQLGLPVKFVGVGETPDDIQPFDPGAFIDALFGAEA